MSKIQAWLPFSSSLTQTARGIYGPIVASARQRTFYADWGVPDSREGRFEMLALQVALVMVRLGGIGSRGSALARSLGETFIADMDDNMREIGISDMAVPRKIKKIGAALMDRHRDYGAALLTADTAMLLSSIRQALLGAGARDTLDDMALSNYTERLWGALVVTPDEECLAGRLPLPWPAGAA